MVSFDKLDLFTSSISFFDNSLFEFLIKVNISDFVFSDKSEFIIS